MADITIKEIEKAYEVGLLRHKGKLKLKEADRALVDATGMTASSAQMYVRAVVNMLDGRRLNRTINLVAARCFLDNIQRDFGPEGLEKALTSFEAHADYYESKGRSRKVSARKLIQEYRGRQKNRDIDYNSYVFDDDLLDLFDATEGAYSVVTKQEASHSQITITGPETDIIVSHFGKENIHIGPKRDDEEKATKEFYLFPDGEISRLTVNYPKPGKTELQVYASIKQGFMPAAGDIWFVFRRAGADRLFIGSMTQNEWKAFTTSAVFIDDPKDEVEDLVYQEIINRPSSPKAQKATSSLKYPRCAKTAKECMGRAEFICELDSSHVTFASKATGQPYIEGHHLVPLAFQDKFKNSLDVHANIVILCPNCHRAIHHAGMDVCAGMLHQLYEARKIELEQSGIKIEYDELVEFYA